MESGDLGTGLDVGVDADASGGLVQAKGYAGRRRGLVGLSAPFEFADGDGGHTGSLQLLGENPEVALGGAVRHVGTGTSVEFLRALRAVDLACTGSNRNVRPGRSDGAIWAAGWSLQTAQRPADHRSPSRRFEIQPVGVGDNATLRWSAS